MLSYQIKGWNTFLSVVYMFYFIQYSHHKMSINYHSNTNFIIQQMQEYRKLIGDDLQITNSMTDLIWEHHGVDYINHVIWPAAASTPNPGSTSNLYNTALTFSMKYCVCQDTVLIWDIKENTYFINKSKAHRHLPCNRDRQQHKQQHTI